MVTVTRHLEKLHQMHAQGAKNSAQILNSFVYAYFYINMTHLPKPLCKKKYFFLVDPKKYYFRVKKCKIYISCDNFQ